MLFHVTAKHGAHDCQMYNEEIRAALQEFVQSLPERIEELDIKVHFAVNGEPQHVFYMLLEADDYLSVCGMLSQIPIKQEFDIKPVRMISFGNAR